MHDWNLFVTLIKEGLPELNVTAVQYGEKLKEKIEAVFGADKKFNKVSLTKFLTIDQDDKKFVKKEVQHFFKMMMKCQALNNLNN